MKFLFEKKKQNLSLDEESHLKSIMNMNCWKTSYWKKEKKLYKISKK